jgi:DNA-binding transcriptional ArsR family regulator
MLAFVPTVFDLYRPLKAHPRWTLQNLVSFADRTGRCFPSVRKLAAFAGLSKSAVSRHLRDLVEAGVITRQRRPGGVYDYEIDPRFLPRAPVSHQQDRGVPRQAAQETEPEKQTKTRGHARFANRGVSFGELPDERLKWEARLRSWRKNGFWLPNFGPKPNEVGSLVPIELLTP